MHFRIRLFVGTIACVEFIGIPVAVLTMFLAQRAEQRMGPAAAGWFAALPVAFAVAAATIAVTSTPSDAANLALSAAGHIGPMITYAVAFVTLVPRVGAPTGVGISALVYVLASVLLLPVPEAARVVLGVAAAAGGALYMARQPRPVSGGRPASTTQQVLSLASAAAVVTLIASTNQLAGPVLAGAVGTFPVMTTTLALFIAHRSGRRQAAFVMQGLVKSLPIYLTFCLVFGLSVTRIAIPGSLSAATLLALLAAMLTWRSATGNRPTIERSFSLT